MEKLLVSIRNKVYILIVVVAYFIWKVCVKDNPAPGNFNAEWTSTELYCYYIAFISVFISTKYDVFRYIIEDKKRKEMSSLIRTIVRYMIGAILIFVVLPKVYQPKDWFFTNYMELKENGAILKFMLDFLLLPIHYPSINIEKMILCEMIFSAIFVWLYYIRTRKSKRIKEYVIERALKIFYALNYLIVYVIFLFTMPDKYLSIKYAKATIIGVIIIFTLIIAIRMYLSIRNCKRLNKKVQEIDNIILVVTSRNYRFTLKMNYRNPLRFFNKYNIEGLGKELVIKGKRCVYASYDVDRLNLLDLSRFKNVGYLIILDAYSGEDETRRSGSYIRFVDYISEITNHFMIYYPPILDTIKNTEISSWAYDRYIYAYTTKLDTKEVSQIINITEKAKILKSNCKKVLEGIKLGQDKNTYIRYGLRKIINSFNYTECFYTLLKICEYIIHYSALIYIINNPHKAKNKDIRSGVISAWRECIDFIDETYTNENSKRLSNRTDLKIEESDVIKSFNKVKKIFSNDKDNYKNVTSCSLKEDICGIIAQIRNKLVAHGVITYEIAEDLVLDLFNFAFVLIRKFKEIPLSIREDEKIKYIFKKDISAVYRIDNRLFLYSSTETGYKDNKLVDLYKECVNYETGRRKVIDQKIQIKTDYNYSEEEIVTQIGKWEIK